MRRNRRDIRGFSCFAGVQARARQRAVDCLVRRPKDGGALAPTLLWLACGEERAARTAGGLAHRAYRRAMEGSAARCLP
eukprot:3303731-Prymnesium_polylepis.2